MLLGNGVYSQQHPGPAHHRNATPPDATTGRDEHPNADQHMQEQSGELEAGGRISDTGEQDAGEPERSRYEGQVRLDCKSGKSLCRKCSFVDGASVMAK
jgi:hypothetical protein